MGKGTFKEHFKFHNFKEIFYCDMTRLRNTNLNTFIQCQYTTTILRSKNMGQSLFKKHSKFLIFSKSSTDMARRGTNNRWFSENIFEQKTTLGKKTMRPNNFRKCSRCHRFSELF